MTGNTKTLTGPVQRNVYALVRESEHKNLLRELPDIFHNPNVIVRVVPDDVFATMLKDEKSAQTET